MSPRSDRLSPLDVSFLHLETPRTAMHVGTVAIFAPPRDGSFDHEHLVRLVEARLARAPRYRQKIRTVPGHLANPVWVDDEHFDVNYHVRRSALPRPGSDDQLRELVGRVQSRPLDRSRPLWELYIVEGLADGRFAIITKVHHALLDDVSALDIGALLLDPDPTVQAEPVRQWRPRREPSAVDLVAGALADTVRRPTELLDTVRSEVTDVRAATERVLDAAGGAFTAVRRALRPAPASPLDVRVGEARRFGTATADLDDYKLIRKAHGGTVNDVVLATVSGALRTWLLTRGESVTPSTVVRAMVPVSVRGEDDTAGHQVSALFVDLPVGEPSPVVRLHRVAYATKAHKESGRSVAAPAIGSMGGFAPPAVHAAAARLAARATRRLFNVVVTNVPGPQFPLYAGGGQMLECYPVVPLAEDQALAIGLTSYNGGVFYGLNVDRDAMPDVDVLAQCLEEALAELKETVR